MKEQMKRGIQASDKVTVRPLLLTSHISFCVAELLAFMVRPSPSRSPSRSPGIWAPTWDEGDGEGGCSASVQNRVRGPWSSQK